MSALRDRLAEHDSGILSFEAGCRYFGRRGSLNRWCDLLGRGDRETMAELLDSGAVDEDELRDCFLEAA